MGKRILIVDDDEEFCEEMQEILKDEGYCVSLIFDGLKVNNLLKENKYDLILLDMKIPGISGLEVLKSIREKNIITKVILITGGFIGENLPKNDSGNKKQEDESILKLADDIVTKPFDIKLILDKISSII